MMKKNTSLIALAVAFVSSLVSLNVTAADQLNASQVKDMFSDKTISAVNAENKLQTTYFSPDGTVIQKTPTGDKKQGTWRVDSNGQQCITWSGATEVCSTVVALGDGTYQRIVGGKVTVTIQKMSQGNLLDK